MHFVRKKELSVPKMKLQKHTVCTLTKFFQRNWSCQERIIIWKYKEMNVHLHMYV